MYFIVPLMSSCESSSFSFRDVENKSESSSFMETYSIAIVACSASLIFMGTLASLIYLTHQRLEQQRMLNKKLSLWCEEGRLVDQKQYELRVKAAKAIEKCYKLNLKQLDLSEHGLTCLPPAIGELRALRKLCIQNNRLQGLPNELEQLTSLTYLAMHGNLITELPLPIFERLSSLNHLSTDKCLYDESQEKLKVATWKV